MNKSNFLIWSLVFMFFLGFGIWGLGFGLGGCASTEQEIIIGTTTTTTTASTTTKPSSTTTSTTSPSSSSTTTTTTTTTYPTPTIPFGDDWVRLDNLVAYNTGYSFDIKVSKGGMVYVAYWDMDNSGQIRVKKYSGGNWIPVGGAVSDYQAYYSLAILGEGEGTPYIGFSYGGSQGAVKRYDGSSWEVVASFTTTSEVDGILKFRISDDGTPYVAFSDKSDGYKAKVLRYSGGDWVNLGGNASAGGGVGGMAFFLYGNVPYLGYQDSTLYGYLGTVRKYNGVSWEGVGPAGFTPGIPDAISVFVSNDIPYFKYYGNIMSYESSSDSWNFICTNDSGTSILSFFVDNGIPYEAQLDTMFLTLKKYSNGIWTEVPPGGTVTTQIASCSLFIHNGIPYIAVSRAVPDDPFRFYIEAATYTGP